MYHNLPKDLIELKPYFAELQIKPKNPEFHHWAQMYDADQGVVPSTFESVWTFFGHHMYSPHIEQDKQIKIVADPKKLTERCHALVCYINGSVPEMPKSQKRKAPDDRPSEGVRFCPRCIAKDKDAPNILQPREQYCSGCKAY